MLCLGVVSGFVSPNIHKYYTQPGSKNCPKYAMFYCKCSRKANASLVMTQTGCKNKTMQRVLANLLNTFEGQCLFSRTCLEWCVRRYFSVPRPLYYNLKIIEITYSVGALSQWNEHLDQGLWNSFNEFGSYRANTIYRLKHLTFKSEICLKPKWMTHVVCRSFYRAKHLRLVLWNIC